MLGAINGQRRCIVLVEGNALVTCHLVWALRIVDL